jgi:hypothetical protein
MFNVMNYLMFFLHVIIGFLDNISIIFLGAGIGMLAVERNDRSWDMDVNEHDLILNIC